MYKLFTDKNENFECKVKIEGASIKNSTARMILETEELNLIYYGKINSNGVCEIPIKKLRGILPEDTIGKMKLEIIAEDTRFEPWTDDFTVGASKKVQVEVKNSTDDKKSVIVEVEKKENKELPIVKRVFKEKVKEKVFDVQPVVEYLIKEKINSKNILKHKKIIMPIIKKYAEKIGVDQSKFLTEVVKKLNNE